MKQIYTYRHLYLISTLGISQTQTVLGAEQLVERYRSFVWLPSHRMVLVVISFCDKY